jgi:hypothetical protein
MSRWSIELSLYMNRVFSMASAVIATALRLCCFQISGVALTPTLKLSLQDKKAKENIR